jgi:hypothetical protein
VRKLTKPDDIGLKTTELLAQNTKKKHQSANRSTFVTEKQVMGSRRPQPTLNKANISSKKEHLSTKFVTRKVTKKIQQSRKKTQLGCYIVTRLSATSSVKKRLVTAVSCLPRATSLAKSCSGRQFVRDFSMSRRPISR